MFSVYARYTGSSRRRSEYIRKITDVIRTQPSVVEVDIRDVENFIVISVTTLGTAQVILSLLQEEFQLGVGGIPLDNSELIPFVKALSDYALEENPRRGSIAVKIAQPGLLTDEESEQLDALSSDIAASFNLLGALLTKRSAEGREATALMREGYKQSDAAKTLGISKQAMSQRLQAAQWTAEQEGWSLALHMLQRV